MDIWNLQQKLKSLNQSLTVDWLLKTFLTNENKSLRSPMRVYAILVADVNVLTIILISSELVSH